MDATTTSAPAVATAPTLHPIAMDYAMGALAEARDAQARALRVLGVSQEELDALLGEAEA